jgi:hypothetical protein
MNNHNFALNVEAVNSDRTSSHAEPTIGITFRQKRHIKMNYYSGNMHFELTNKPILFYKIKTLGETPVTELYYEVEPNA